MPAMSSPAVTRVVEDYVTLIWKALEWPGGTPTTTDLAAQLGVTPSTVSATLKKLARDGFIEYEPYGSIDLTELGRAVAVSIVRRHRLIETYLHHRLGVPWDEVHQEADRLEHAVSDALLERMDDALGRPSHDPHGDPIPGADGQVASDHTLALLDAPAGAWVRVARVSDRSAQILRHLQEMAIGIDTIVQVVRVQHEAEVVRISLEGTDLDISLRTAAAIRVEPLG